MKDKSDLLAIMCKYPAPNNGKTRLGETIGFSNAALVSKALLLDLVEQHKHQSYNLVIRAPEQDSKYKTDFKRLLPDVTIHIGGGTSLRGPDSQLWNAFSTYLGQFQRVIALYADTPFVDNSLVSEAFQILKSYDVVIGPDLGDGYYLIGLKMPYDLFTTMPPDRHPYRTKTIEKARELNLSYSLLVPRGDVDRIEDVHLFQEVDNSNWSRTVETLLSLHLLSNEEG